MKGSSRAPEVNIGIGHLWLDIALYVVASYAVRVESKANFADEPSRNRFQLWRDLGAEHVALPSQIGRTTFGLGHLKDYFEEVYVGF